MRAGRRGIFVILSDFNEFIQAALEKLLECEHMGGFNIFRYQDGAATIIVDSGDSYVQQLVFQDAVFSEGFDISLYPYAFKLCDTENDYCLEFIQDNESGIQLRCKLRFSAVNAEIRCFNYTKGIIYDYEPWRAVANYLYEMKNKRELIGPEFLNEEEKRLLPLAEFTPLTRFLNIMTDSNDSKAAAEIFISYAERAHANDIVSLVRQYERFADSKEEKEISRRLHKKMVNVGAEPIYHMIVNDIKDSAAVYPDKIISLGSGFIAGQIRKSTELFLLSQGFQGNFPNFRKMSSFNGLHLLFIDKQLAALWNEKHMASYIDCHEEYINGEFSIHYVSGTVFLRRDQVNLFPVLTADSGFFIDKDRRRGKAVLSKAYWGIEGFSVEEENLKAAEIASRLAQCARLTPQERKQYLSSNSMKIEGRYILLLLWALGGSFFGAAMCIGFALMEVAAGLIFTGNWLRTWSLIRETPWHRIFIFCGASFGLIMLILSLIGRKRG
jgi:hypothetical protein